MGELAADVASARGSVDARVSIRGVEPHPEGEILVAVTFEVVLDLVLPAPIITRSPGIARTKWGKISILSACQI